MSWKINLGLMLAISTVLVFQAHQRLGREVALFETDVRRDHHVMGRVLRNAVEDAMEDAGADAAIDLVAFLVNDDGSFLSNHALPPFPDQAENPGAAATPLPGVVRFTLDSDGDGRPDGAAAPEVLP